MLRRECRENGGFASRLIYPAAVAYDLCRLQQLVTPGGPAVLQDWAFDRDCYGVALGTPTLVGKHHASAARAKDFAHVPKITT